MPERLDSHSPDFDAALAALLDRATTTSSPDIVDTVRGTIASVRADGDDALKTGTKALDRFDTEDGGLWIDVDTRDRLAATVKPEVRAALQLAADRISAFHEKQLPVGLDYVDAGGTRLGQRWTAVDAVGLYVPGGLAAYPSSVLMNALPAKVAGVSRMVITTPTPDGAINPLVMAAAQLVGVTDILRVGGAHAVAALAYGTESLAPVDKIVGPGNAYVAEAKRQVFGHVGIDSIAGPSEILVIADSSARADWIAVDLLSQAEHDSDAQSILITTDRDLADSVAAQVDRVLETLPRADIAGASWRDNGAIITAATLDEAADIANIIAAEHVELMVEDPDSLMAKVRHAGAIFLGAYTPEALGDYVAGPNHVLPTSQSARFSSGLSVYDFLKRTTFVGATKESFGKIGPSAATLAHEEGLQAHALSAEIRLEDGKPCD